MKKIVVTFVFLLGALTMQAQTFGASGLSVKGDYSSAKTDYNKWLRIGNTFDATMKFEQTEQGLDQAIGLVQRMLIENNLEIGRPDVYKSVGAEGTANKSSNDLNELIMKGKTRVNLAWFSPDGSTLQLFLDKNSYEVNVMNAYKVR